MEKSIFDYRDYKEYLAAALDARKGKGLRSRLAESLHCQPAFIYRVLNLGEVHFSQEHAMLINQFLGHDTAESHYFMLLLHYARAGSRLLEDYYRKQIQEIHEKRQLISERIQVKNQLSELDQTTYYSEWYYSAIHILLLVPGFQTKSEIAGGLKLPLPLVGECLEFLKKTGLASHEGGRYKAGASRIHLAKNSPMTSKHHANWRIKAIQALETRSVENLHFSGPMSISEDDALKIKEMLLKVLEQTEPLIRASKDEGLFCLSMDFFRV